MSTEEDLKKWGTRMAVGRMAYDAGYYSQAARHFQLALNLAQESRLPEELLARTYVNIAKTHSSQGHFDEAEKLIKRAMQIDASGTEQSVALIDDYCQLSVLYWHSGKTELAGQTVREAERMLNDCPDAPDELQAKLFNQLAIIAGHAGHLAECERYLDRALAVVESSTDLGKDSLIYGQVLMVKVLLLAEQDRIDEAIEFYPQALQVIETHRGAYHPKVADLFEVFADYTAHKHLDDISAKFHEQAEDIRKTAKKMHSP